MLAENSLEIFINSLNWRFLGLKYMWMVEGWIELSVYFTITIVQYTTDRKTDRQTDRYVFYNLFVEFSSTFWAIIIILQSLINLLLKHVFIYLFIYLLSLYFNIITWIDR